MNTANGFWMRRTADGIGATSEVMFPTNPHGAPDWQQTQMVERTVDYLGELPPPMRRLLMFMFVVIELGAPLLLAGPRRFSKLSRERRLKVLLSWRGSWFFPHKMLADALKAQLCMMYLSHPAVQKHIEAWKACSRENDPLGLPIRENVFDETAHNGLREGVA